METDNATVAAIKLKNDCMYKSSESKIVKIVEDESGFAISDGIVLYPRASVEFGPDCPTEYMQIIQKCRIKGWLKSVAYVTTEEHMWHSLRN
jgi:hypothetical protein